MTQPPQGPPEGWEPRPQGGASDRRTEPQWPTQGPQWGASERPTESHVGRWETYGPPAPSGQDHSAWAAQQRTQPERWQPQPSEAYPAQPLSEAVRRSWLAQQVDDHVRRGWQIESRTENLASLRFGKPINHVLQPSDFHSVIGSLLAWRQCRFAPDRTAPPGLLNHQGQGCAFDWRGWPVRLVR